ncbi:prolipoprotein diacylglyceryl transferase [Acidiferrimicrobium sp. IK]|uniref:prolipoprotein diacylglyceryl transferase n=1 Tax=Acidiferrimicrobium sp. IK TaxID=2871700 RepID=UPI0021CB3CF6|nr:prolipoprotein diacylglyceryl transferase [Acidiferrimicrobium sp. IK]MCU4184551.1 prolipoprotein diacylglyceryl transferase [Acidiferrimicrobium sp. IK]
MLAYLPSPPTSGLSLGPFRLHVYGLLIAAGVVAAVWLAQRRWRDIGGAPGTWSMLAVWGVPGGLVGSRIYSVITSWQADTGGHWYRIFAIWQGGLGIWGGIAGGVALGLIGARRHHLRIPPLLDTVAPALVLAQAVGRWGNYFNQELYGRPSGLPWAVKIDQPVHCSSVTNCVPYPPGVSTFQPTFLYESIWDLAVVGLLILAGRKLRIRRGYLFALYVALYTVGRFWTEYLRVDEAHKLGPFRLNDWVSIATFVAAMAVLLVLGRARPGDERVGDPLRPGEPGTVGYDPADQGEGEGSQGSGRSEEGSGEEGSGGEGSGEGHDDAGVATGDPAGFS